MQGLPHAACRLQRASPCSQGCCGSLPPHAPCRLQPLCRETQQSAIVFASTRSVQIATWLSCAAVATCGGFASTRSVQIATSLTIQTARPDALCLHTLRADCNHYRPRARTRPHPLCLHTLRADCNIRCSYATGVEKLFASTRSVQIATAEMHRMQYALFRTCVESVDSFSVLNKAMLR